MSSIRSFTFGRFCRTTFETFWKPMSPIPPSPPMAHAFGSSATSRSVIRASLKWDEGEVLRGRHHVLVAGEEGVGEPLGDDRPAGVVLDERLAEEPRDRGAVLEERVHPRVGVRVVRRRRPEDGVAAGVGAHRHDRHAVREPPVDRLQLAVVPRLLREDGAERVDDLGVGDRPVRGEADVGVLVVLAAEPHQEVRDRPDEGGVPGRGTSPSGPRGARRRPRRAASPSPPSRSAFAW